VTLEATYNDAWKGRGSLVQLVEELERQKESRVDFVAPAQGITFGNDENVPTIIPNPLTSEWVLEPSAFKRSALSQFLASLGITGLNTKMFDSVKGKGSERVSAAWADLVNQLLANADPTRRHLVRMLDGEVRAWLSDSYRAFDSYDLSFTALEEAEEVDARVLEAALSDTHMRLKFTVPSIYDAITLKQTEDRGKWFSGGLGNQEYLSKVGARSHGEFPGGPDALYPVVSISHSETGHGAGRVSIGVLLGACFNVATVEDIAAEIHLGGKLDEGIFTPETQAKETAAVMAKLRDAIRAGFNEDKFREIVAQAKASNTTEIAPVEAVDVLVGDGDITQEKRDSLLTYFVRDYSPTQFGLAQAVSRLAQDTDDADEASDLEALAGKVLVGA
jgi:hypothetical protein